MTEVTREDLAAGLAENKRAIEALTKEFTEEMAVVRVEMAKMAKVLEAYTALEKGGKMVEWAAKIIAALLVIWAFFKGGWQFLVEIGKGG